MRAEIAQLNGNANFSLFRKIFIESSWRKAKSLSSKKLFRDFTVIIQTRASGDVTCVCSDMFESWSSWVRLGKSPVLVSLVNVGYPSNSSEHTKL